MPQNVDKNNMYKLINTIQYNIYFNNGISKFLYIPKDTHINFNNNECNVILWGNFSQIELDSENIIMKDSIKEINNRQNKLNNLLNTNTELSPFGTFILLGCITSLEKDNVNIVKLK